jgi:hypothetical protein
LVWIPAFAGMTMEVEALGRGLVIKTQRRAYRATRMGDTWSFFARLLVWATRHNR